MGGYAWGGRCYFFPNGANAGFYRGGGSVRPRFHVVRRRYGGYLGSGGRAREACQGIGSSRPCGRRGYGGYYGNRWYQCLGHLFILIRFLPRPLFLFSLSTPVVPVSYLEGGRFLGWGERIFRQVPSAGHI